MKPAPWWEEYLGLKIRFDHPLKPKPKRVWKTLLYYLAWIVPTALFSLFASWSAAWFSVQPQTPVQARPKEVHVASESEQELATLEAMTLEEAMVSSPPLIQVFASDTVHVGMKDKARVQLSGTQTSTPPLPLTTTDTSSESPAEPTSTT